MHALRIKRRLESETLHLPELRPLLGRDVEIIVLDDNGATGTTAEPTCTRSVLELASDVTAGIPDQELSRLPTDGAEQHDHYLYGAPKRR